MIKRTLTSAAALSLAAAAHTHAQEPGGAPGFGTLQFNGAAQSLPARAGGAASLEAVGCFGYSTLQPTAVIEVTGAGPLYIAAGSNTDLTLAVRGPDGAVTCADDEAGAFNPGVVFEAPASGRYEVWVGTYGAAEGYPAITVNVSPDGFDTSNPYIIAPDPDRSADQTLRLSGGFRNDPRRLDVSAGGGAPLSALDGSCTGRTGEAPAAVLTYGGGALPLYFLLEGEADTTLGVVTPSGEILCADDTLDTHAGVRVEAPEAGRYAVFAGLFGDSEQTGPASLSVSEIGFGGVDRRLDVAGDPVFGLHTLAGGFLPDPAAYPVSAGGPVDLRLSLDDAPGGEWCVGQTTRTPTLRIAYDGAGPLFISMESDTDTTLAVNGPDGRWICDDDSLGDLNPMVSFDTAGAGVYDIYAGVFFDGETVPATLYVSEIAAGADPSARAMDLTLDAGATVTLEPGFAESAGRFALTAGGPAEPGDTGGEYCAGAYSNNPSVELRWGGGPLALTTMADADTTLAVNLPDGTWACDDDGGDGFLARLDLDGAPGVYDIWVGTFGGQEADAVLQIAEPGR